MVTTKAVRNFRDYSFSFVLEFSEGFVLCLAPYLGPDGDQVQLSIQRRECEAWRSQEGGQSFPWLGQSAGERRDL